MKIYDMMIEYRNNPLGLDTPPRFSWKLESERQGTRQAAYRIQVTCGGKDVWDSGRVGSDRSILVPYGGEGLCSQTRYEVLVNVWDDTGECAQASGWFEMGLLSPDDWKASWITHTLPDDETACPVYVRRFVQAKPIRAARLYTTACGVYEAKINGRKVGDAFMAPGWTSYHNRIQYQTSDVTELIGEENEVAIMTGNGWYKGILGFDSRPDIYGSRTALLALLRLEYEDGEVVYIGTDTDWEVTTGPVRFSEIYHGETQDYTIPAEKHGNTVLFEQTEQIGRLTAQESEPVRITQRLAPVGKLVTPKGELVFDFGQNITGLVEVRLPKLTGNRLVIRHAETLDKEGNFYTENLRTARSTDTYIYGEAQEGMTVMPHFTFHGFRYICVEGADGCTLDNFSACAMHTDMTGTGSLRTDNQLVNQLMSNILWGQRDNFFDIPTDCPQRDERLGWTGDAQVFCQTASVNYRTALFFRKWLRDMAAETGPEWGVPHVIPNILGNQDGAAAWSDAAVIIPWRLYQAYGDVEMLREQYPMMKAWVDYVRSKTSASGLWDTGFQYGDWLALDIEAGRTDRTGGTDKYLVANAFYAYSTGILRDAAEVLGYESDVREYGRLRETIINAIHREYVTETGRLVSETQTACVLMLYFDIARPHVRPRILQTLVNNINAHRGHLTTGFVGTPYLCHCLTENGLHDLAVQIFLKEDFPGWFYAVKKGATTVWERWNSILENGDFDQSGMNSLNHYAYGSIAGWLYEKVAGIRPLSPGYKKILIAPELTRGMTEVSAEYESVYGMIRCIWTCRGGRINVDVEIPANTEAVIRLPEREGEISVGSGEYHYEYETQTSLEIQKYSMDSTLGDLVAEDLGRKLFDQYAPGMLDNPLIKFAFTMTIADLLAQAPGAEPLYRAVIGALNEAEKAKKQ